MRKKRNGEEHKEEQKKGRERQRKKQPKEEKIIKENRKMGKEQWESTSIKIETATRICTYTYGPIDTIDKIERRN